MTDGDTTECVASSDNKPPPAALNLLCFSVCIPTGGKLALHVRTARLRRRLLDRRPELVPGDGGNTQLSVVRALHQGEGGHHSGEQIRPRPGTSHNHSR